ncbi:MAG: cell surface protein SprA [Bacteroidales bacterium]|nr:cell surface protein SprA [Bacteroidales bacterium]
MRFKNYIIYTVLFITFLVPRGGNVLAGNNILYQQSTQKDSLKYRFKDYKSVTDFKSQSPLYLDNPSNIKDTVSYDSEKNEYIISKKIGQLNYRPSLRMPLGEYMDYQFEQSMRNYWRQKARGDNSLVQSGLFPNLRLGGEVFNKIFGNNAINIVPTGSAELIFKLNINNSENPTIAENLRKTTTFDFEEKITMNVTGNIGDKIKLGVRYDTEATFDFENETKLEYVGKEDEIIKRIEAGNVTLPLPGSLITGSQSLFGLKTEFQFGKLSVTSVFSQQKGESKVIEVKGGAQSQKFELQADEYDANRHFFLSHYFRNNYDKALEKLPIINSAINITKIEVWVTNKVSENKDNRDIVALLDLAETDVFADFISVDHPGYPKNNTNNLYTKLHQLDPLRNFNQISNKLKEWESSGFVAGQDYEKIGSARRLRATDYTLNTRLGYISLNFALNSDEVLAVAYEYTAGGQTFRVGEFSAGQTNGFLVAKLLKGTNLTPGIPTWDLMMKNIYAIGGYQIKAQNFRLNVLYQDDKTGNALNFIPEGKINKKQLIKVLNLDQLNANLDAGPDGRFDFIDRNTVIGEDVTINSSNGRVIFPVLEPFGSYLRKQFASDIADKYVFEELYDSTLTRARLVAEKNRFKLKGEYSSDIGSEIPLNAINIPQGSVKVLAGGRQLTENVEYTVDYNLGRVKIIDAGLLESGTPIQISLESNALYSIKTKTLFGTHLNYQFSENFNVGATIMNLTERPLTQKVAIGEEPISNTIWGLNTSFQTESQFITTLVDKIPLIATKEKSSILVDAEFAHLIPGHSKAIEKEGNAYIDDFEGSETSMDLRSNFSWVAASIPYGQQDLFPEAYQEGLNSGFNRAKIAWYRIDPLFLRNVSETPGHIKGNVEEQSNLFVREVFEQEIFPNKQSETNSETALQVLNVAFYPRERGIYNYDAMGSNFSKGINSEGKLKSPESRWGGVMRKTPNPDFESANVNYIEFWLMDPFAYDETKVTNGKLYFNLGNVSEDVLKDSRIAYEDGLPTTEEVTNVDTTNWGRVSSNTTVITSAFNNLQLQDIGLDGLSDEDEASFFSSYINEINTIVTNNQVKEKIAQDPSNDNFHYFLGADYDNSQLGILDRYKEYNGLDGNSRGDKAYNKTPDTEDINSDRTLSETESYFQYEVDLSSEKMQVGQNYIVDKIERTVNLPGDQKADVRWYQFRIPIREPDKVIGAIQDFKSIRFMRMFLKGFQDSIILRFAKLDLVRGEWRKYEMSLMQGQENLANPEYSNGVLDISSINIEENDNYALPPGVNRVIDPTNPQVRELNEQSMLLRVNNLDDGDARAAYKTINLDLRQYRKLRMYVHANQLENKILRDGDLRIFIRLGTDYKNNYYEYEMPIKVSGINAASPEDIWPEENNLEIVLNDLVDTKLARNKELQKENSTITYNSKYSIYKDNDKKISVRGNPNLSNVVTIMIGIRNPGKQSNSTGDDGMIKSGEIWVNELRLSDFKENGGWAARGTVSTRLADFGTVNIAGDISTPGFGSIDKKVNQRSKEEIINYDLSANLELGKFFPEKAKVSIPMYVGYSQSFTNPEYNPLDPDVPLKVALSNAKNKAERDSIKEIAQDYVRRRSINFTNVKVNKTSRKPHFYNISNFSLSYAYSEVFARNVNIEYDILKNYRGNFNYVYNLKPKPVMPFKKAKGFMRKRAFSIIRDFNFYYKPSNISFRTEVNRRYQANKIRNIYDPNNIIEASYNKEFNWNRYYDLKWDLARSLKLDFTATNLAIIDEPLGEVDRKSSSYDAWKKEVWNNVLDFGRNKQYNHRIKATYRVPINKLPLLGWTSLNVAYNTTYKWKAGTRDIDGELLQGNSINNTAATQVNAQANLKSLYNKVGFLKRINQKYAKPVSSRRKTEIVEYQQDELKLRKKRSKTIYHNLNTENITAVTVVDKTGAEVDGEWTVVTKKKLKFKPEVDVKDARITVEAKIEKRENPLIFLAENTALLLMSVKNISASYSMTEGSSLLGFNPNSKIFGMTSLNNGAPGWPFVLGWQDDNFGSNAIRNNWYTQDTLVTPFGMNSNKNLNIRISLEPFKGLKIDLTANRVYSENINRYYLPGETTPYNVQESGNFSMSYLSIGSAFEKVSSKNSYYSKAYEDFKRYRSDISSRLGDEIASLDNEYNPNTNSDYAKGFGETAQQVMAPSFLAAYGIFDSKSVPLEIFQKIPLPNWSVRLTRLKEIPIIKKYFKSFNISHTYRSSYNIGSFINNSDYIPKPGGYSLVEDSAGNFVPHYEMGNITIDERFSPLINFDMTWVNNLTTRFDIKKSRSITLSFSNNQITEVHSDELGFSVGYRFDNFDYFFDFGDKQHKSDLNIRANFKIRDNKTILRKVSEDLEIASADQRVMIIGISMDYLISRRLTFRLFYDQNITNPLVGTSPYRVSNTDVGFSLRFTLSE